ncbi:MAG: translesion error-prone DNA polymerase V autoproteolytic subunit [Phycisphaerales bacterium]|nr:translesion error-prone DNA polymerase V autoproteolytic subunit [Phycisphaerales bacterium]
MRPLSIARIAPGIATIPRPLLASRIEAGFPSPADDYVDRTLDLNEELITRPAATFFLRAGGRSMQGAGIHDGDLLVVDRSISPRPGLVVVAVVNGEFTVKRLRQTSEGLVLAPEHPGYKPIVLGPDLDAWTWGVVTYVIHQP